MTTLAGKTIAVVVGDMGGAKEVVPVAKELERRGAKVEYFLDSSPKAKAGDVLAKAGVSYETRGPGCYDRLPNSILVGTSATANGGQVEFTAWMRERGVPVIWMEDLHGTGSRANSRSVAPDVMLVIDEMAAEFSQKVRPGLKTIVVGKPTFSDPKEMPRLEDGPLIRAKVRGELGVTHSDSLMVIGFGGDPAERAEEQLFEIMRAMSRWIFRDELVIAWRFHPQHPKKDEMYDRAVAVCDASGIRTVDARKTDMNHLTIAADVCVADWGNTNQMTGVIHGTSVVTMLFPEDARLVDTYPLDGVPPVVATDPRWGVKSINDLTMMVGHTLNMARLDRLNYNQEVRGKAFMSLLRPGAAELAASAVELVVLGVAAAPAEVPPSSIEGPLVPHGYGALPPFPDMIGMTAEELQRRQGSAEPHSAGEDTGPMAPQEKPVMKPLPLKPQSGCGHCDCGQG